MIEIIEITQSVLNYSYYNYNMPIDLIDFFTIGMFSLLHYFQKLVIRISPIILIENAIRFFAAISTFRLSHIFKFGDFGLVRDTEQKLAN